MTDEIAIRFWGVRGSYPVSGPDTVRFGGNTPCLELRVANQTIVLDAGTGCIGLGRELVSRALAAQQPIVATVLFSHMHHDHTQGFPFFSPAYVGSSHLYMFGPSIFERDLEEILARTMLPPNFPVGLTELPALKEISTVRETEAILIDPETGKAELRNRFHDATGAEREMITVHALRSYAHPDGVLIYRIQWRGKSVVYASDTEGYVDVDQRLAAFAQGADVLIHDAQYSEEHYLGLRAGSGSTQGWGHSTPQMACAVAQAAQVKQLVLFHHEPQYDDAMIARMEQAAQALFPATISAYEGLEMTLGSRITTNTVTLEHSTTEVPPETDIDPAILD